MSCPFCAPSRPLLAATPLAVAFADAYPTSPGHTLITPRRHAPTYFDCTSDEKLAVWSLVDHVRELLSASHHTDAFNVGFNVGAAAGQTVFHAHVHVIPRYTDDVSDPRGGVRHAVIGRGYP